MTRIELKNGGSRIAIGYKRRSLDLARALVDAGHGAAATCRAGREANPPRQLTC